MKNKILITLLASSLLAGSLIASDSYDENYHKYDKEKSHYSKYKKSKYDKSGCSHSKKSHFSHKRDKRSMDLAMMFRGLNLTKEQRFKISIISDEMKLEIKKQMGFASHKFGSLKKYLTENGFDKNSYLKDKKAKLQKLLEIRADAMEKAFKVLTPEQIKMFKERKRGYKKYKKNYHK